MSKLVRDKIPVIIEEKDGFRPLFHTVTWSALRTALDVKLDEEIAELRSAENPASHAEEIADVIEVLLAIAKQDGYAPDAIERIRLSKREKRGGFEDGIILEKW